MTRSFYLEAYPVSGRRKEERDGPRYITPSLKQVWSPQSTNSIAFRLWWAHLHWMHQCGWSGAYSKASPEALKALKDESRHEVVDLLRKFVAETGLVNAHAGLTSSDIVDNIRLIQCDQSVRIVVGHLHSVVTENKGRLGVAELCLGYTHWRPASRLTWEHRVSAWVSPLSRLEMSPPSITAKRFGGATGTGAAIEILQDEGARIPFNWGSFGLRQPASSFPLQSSDHHAELECAHWLSAIAGQLHKMATDMRFLVQTGELRISRSDNYRGSSCMPLKVNPIEAEKVCALTRMVPGCYRTIWDCLAHNGLERTLDTSAALKDTLPRMFGLVGEALVVMQEFISVLGINHERCRHLLNYYGDAAAAEEEMARRIKGGKSRMEAYEEVYRDKR